MLKPAALGFLICILLLCVSATHNEYSKCNCDYDDESNQWFTERILAYQSVSDFFIAMAYFSIPIQLFYHITFSKFPFKWLLLQFTAFIVFCGMTHLLTIWTHKPHTHQLMVTLNILKTLTAIVSFSFSVTLISYIPMFLKVKIREFMLKKKTLELGREVNIIRKQREDGKHVRMLTQKIRKSLDKDKILHTTLEELSKTMGLQNCAVWMPNFDNTVMSLTHELNGRNLNFSIPITNPDVARIKWNDAVNKINPESELAVASSGVSGEAGPVAAIRMPILRVCNFNGGIPERTQACYAILVLVLPSEETRFWSNQELEVIKVVADQVAVALSHAAILEESELMREKLEAQNRALHKEKMNIIRANQARVAFQNVMSNRMEMPMQSNLGLLSRMQHKNLKCEQKLILDSLLRTNNVLFNMIRDSTDNNSDINDGRFPLKIRPFGLHDMIKEAACIFKCLSLSNGFGFKIEVDKSLPDNAIGDDRRVLQVIFTMVRNLIGNHEGGIIVFRVFAETGNQGRINWRLSSSSGDLHIRFEIGVIRSNSELETSISSRKLVGVDDRVDDRLSFDICNRIIHAMQGNIWSVTNTEGFPQVVNLALRFKLCR